MGSLLTRSAFHMFAGRTEREALMDALSRKCEAFGTCVLITVKDLSEWKNRTRSAAADRDDM